MKMKFTPLILAMACAASAVPAMADESAETWRSLGVGHFREVFAHADWNYSYYPDIEVDIEESEQTPGRYRLVNAYNNYPDVLDGTYMREGDWYIVIDASDPDCVFIERSFTGFVYGRNGEDHQLELVAHSVAGHMLDEQNLSKEEVQAEGAFGKLRHGKITFPDNMLLGTPHDFEADYAPGEDDPTNYLYKRCNKNGEFRVLLPGAPSLEVESSFVGIDDAHTTLIYNVELEADVQKARCALVEDEAGQTQVDRVINGQIPSVEITESGEVRIPYTADGRYTFIVVPYYNNEPIEPIFLTHELAFDESEWRKVGQAYFYESMLSSIEILSASGVGFPAIDYMVDVEENVERPGYLRLVDAYGENYPYSNSSNYDGTQHWYININATDPDHVYLEYTEGLGINAGYGRIDLWSYYERALKDPTSYYYGWTIEQCEKAGFFGRFADNEITFPKQALCLRMPLASSGWYNCNQNGAFCLKFEEGQLRGEQSGVESVIADDYSDAPARYYRLDGISVSADNLTPGIYVVRKGNTTSKIVVK